MRFDTPSHCKRLWNQKKVDVQAGSLLLVGLPGTHTQIKKMKLVHACGPYGNDCSGPGTSMPSHPAALKALPTLRKTHITCFVSF